MSKKLKKVLIGISLVMLFFLAVVSSYFYGLYKNVVVTDAVDVYEEVIPATPTPTPDPFSPKNILLLGYGGPGHDGGYLTDTIILAKVYPRDKKIVLISIPRDLWVEIPVSEEESAYIKINNAYSIGRDKRYTDIPTQYKGEAGGGKLAKEIVGEVLGVNVDYFVSIDFGGFKRVIDTLNGITVFVPYTFDDQYYPIKGKEDDTCEKSEEEIEAVTATMSGDLLEKEFKCRYEDLHFDKGVQVLDSENALKFVRSRHSSIGGSDFGRSLRQQAFLEAIKDELLSVRSVKKIIPLLSETSRNVKTDINFTEAYKLLLLNGDIGEVEVYSISLNDDNMLMHAVSSDGQYTLIPVDGQGNYERIKSYVSAQIEKSFIEDEDVLGPTASPNL